MLSMQLCVTLYYMLASSYTLATQQSTSRLNMICCCSFVFAINYVVVWYCGDRGEVLALINKSFIRLAEARFVVNV